MAYTKNAAVGAAKFINPALGRRVFLKPSHISPKGGAQKYIPGLGTNFVFSNAKEVNAKGGLEKLIPGLGKNFFVHPDHVK